MNRNSITPADEALLVAYLDGDLSLKDAAALEERLATDPALAAALRRFTAADQWGRELASGGPAPDDA